MRPTVTFIFRAEEYDNDTPDRGVAEIIVAKNRHGDTGTARLAWLPQYTALRQHGHPRSVHDEAISHREMVAIGSHSKPPERSPTRE